jgi:hypothetical protein
MSEKKNRPDDNVRDFAAAKAKREAEEMAAKAARAAADKSPEDLEIARLALLDDIQYDQQRKEAAEKLGIRVGALDKAVAKARPAAEAPGHGDDLFAPAEPWGDPVDLVWLLDETEQAFRRHVVMTDHASVICAAWVAHTWVYDRFDHTPRFDIGSPVKGCGKSTLLEVLRITSRRALKADNISAAAMFRAIEMWHPTLLVDEADTFLPGNEELRGIISSGFERSGMAIRAVEKNGEFVPVPFCTFGPIAIAGLGGLPPTIASRSIPIRLQKKAKSDKIIKLRASGARKRLADIASQYARWSADVQSFPVIGEADIPDKLDDREGDICVPLLAIADLAGGDWPDNLRKALVSVFGARAAVDEQEHKLLLLTDIREIFAADDPPKSAHKTNHIISELIGMTGHPWADYGRGKDGITAHALAKLLRPFGIQPTQNVGGKKNVRGYEYDDFLPVWQKYLPSLSESPPPESAQSARTAEEPQKTNGSSEIDQSLETGRASPQQSSAIARDPENRLSRAAISARVKAAWQAKWDAED